MDLRVRLCATEMPSEREQEEKKTPNKINEQKIMKSSVCSALLSVIWTFVSITKRNREEKKNRIENNANDSLSLID